MPDSAASGSWAVIERRGRPRREAACVDRNTFGDLGDAWDRRHQRRSWVLSSPRRRRSPTTGSTISRWSTRGRFNPDRSGHWDCDQEEAVIAGGRSYFDRARRTCASDGRRRWPEYPLRAYFSAQTDEAW